MPELPDVEVYVDCLRERIVDRELLGVRLASPFVLRSVKPPIREAAGRLVATIERLGKRIVLGLKGDDFLVIHLMIAGRFLWLKPGSKIPRKVGLAGFDFEDGMLLLREAASKKRASLHFVRGRAALKEHDRGGLEPLDASLEDFTDVLRRENHTLKRSLTDPRLLSGIGNAYSDEILHHARLSPLKLTSRLDDQEIRTLHASMVKVLREWTAKLRAETGASFPKKVTAFRKEMSVHGRYRESCPRCGSAVQRILYAQNECNYCPQCQTEGRLLADRAMSRLLKKDWPRNLAEFEELRATGRTRSRK